MKILMTGAGGFIGSHLIAAFSPEHEIIAPTEKQMDLRDGAAVNAMVADHKPEVVIHLAARTEVAHSFAAFEDFGNVNYLGTVRLAEANRMYNPNLRQFFMASTMETYGNQPEGTPFTETTPQHPMAPYAVAKMAAEKYLYYMQHAYDFPHTIFRQTNAYGRTNNDFFVMERILTQMLAGDVCNLGARNPERNFLFIDDLVALYKAAFLNPKAIRQTFVTGPDNAISISDLADLCAKVLSWKGKINWGTIPHRPGEIYYLNSDPDKAKRLLGWEPKMSLEDGIIETIDRLEATREALVA